MTNPGADRSDLEVGMIVSLNGEVNEDGTTGNANSIPLWGTKLKGARQIDLLANNLSVLAKLVVVFDEKTSLDGTLLTETFTSRFSWDKWFFNGKGWATRHTNWKKETEVSKLKVWGKVESLDYNERKFLS